VLAQFAALDLDLSLASLWKRAPVFDAVRLTRPQIELTRNDDGRYGIEDLIERLAAEPEGPPALFSINNIEVDEGVVALDDRPHKRKVVVSAIGIGIPFLSSFPYDAKIHVTPRFDGLRTFLKKQGAAEDFFYFGPRTGWAYRYLKEERSLCSIHLSAGRLVGIVAVDGATQTNIPWDTFSDVGRRARKLAHGTPALLWLDVPLDGTGAGDFKTLLKAKLARVGN